MEQRREQKLLPAIVKDIYTEHDELKAMTKEEVRAYRLAKQLSLRFAFTCLRRNKIIDIPYGVQPKYPYPKPVLTFAHAFHRYPQVMRAIERQGLTDPTSVQCQAWPVLLSGHDLIAISQTGTGKTLAYALPAILHVLRQPSPRPKWIGPSVVVMAPTSELVQQIGAEMNKYVFGGVRVECLYECSIVSDEDRQTEQTVKRRPHVLVTTPGRLDELVIIWKYARLNNVSYLVLDEADHMTDMFHSLSIISLLKKIRSDRQTVVISATWPEEVRELADLCTQRPLILIVGSVNLATVDPVRQLVHMLADESDKEQWLDDFLDNQLSPNDRLIIFVRDNRGVDKLFRKLLDKNLPCRRKYKEEFLLQRRDQEASFETEHDGSMPILIVTDSTGMDIKRASLVINYDYPDSIHEYMHRVGRIGRNGLNITLLTDINAENAYDLIEILVKNKQPVPSLLYSKTEGREEKKKRLKGEFHF